MGETKCFEVELVFTGSLSYTYVLPITGYAVGYGNLFGLDGTVYAYVKENSCGDTGVCSRNLIYRIVLNEVPEKIGDKFTVFLCYTEF